MASLNADNYSRLVSVPMEQMPVGDVSGKVRIAYDQITLSAELAIGDIINVCAPIPDRARILEAQLISGALGAGSLSLGYSADAAYFIAAASCASAANLKMVNEPALLARNPGLVQPQVKVSANASTTGAGKTIKVLIKYVLE